MSTALPLWHSLVSRRPPLALSHLASTLSGRSSGRPLSVSTTSFPPQSLASRDKVRCRTNVWGRFGNSAFKDRVQ